MRETLSYELVISFFSLHFFINTYLYPTSLTTLVSELQVQIFITFLMSLIFSGCIISILTNILNVDIHS